MAPRHQKGAARRSERPFVLPTAGPGYMAGAATRSESETSSEGDAVVGLAASPWTDSQECPLMQAIDFDRREVIGRWCWLMGWPLSSVVA